MASHGAAADLVRRRADTLAGVGPAGAESLLVTDPLDVRYLTGFTGSSGWLLLRPAESVLLTDPRYREQAATEAQGCSIVVTAAGLVAGLAEVEGLDGRVAYAPGAVSVERFRELCQEIPGVDWVDAGRTPLAARRRKDDHEIDAMGRALRLAESVLEDVVAGLQPTWTERQLAARLDFRCRERGAERMAFETIVAAGPHGALPHARPRDRPIRAGDVLLVDMGCVVDGYCSDITRMGCVGRPPEPWVRWHGAVDRALEAAVEAMAPGVPCVDVDAAARASLARDGLADAFVHSLGHGVGLDVHEAPRLSSRSEDVLEEGMVLTVEPGVYVPDQGGLRLEDMVRVTAAGAERLNRLPRHFLRAGPATS